MDFTAARDDGVEVASAGAYANHLHLTPDRYHASTSPHHSVFTGQIGRPYIFSCCGLFFLLSSFFSSPNLSRRRLDVCHTLTMADIQSVAAEIRRGKKRRKKKEQTTA